MPRFGSIDIKSSRLCEVDKVEPPTLKNAKVARVIPYKLPLLKKVKAYFGGRMHG